MGVSTRHGPVSSDYPYDVTAVTIGAMNVASEIPILPITIGVVGLWQRQVWLLYAVGNNLQQI